MTNYLLLPANRRSRPPLTDFLRFLVFLLLYFKNKALSLLSFFGQVIFSALSAIGWTKFQVTRKLIFGRGALGQPVSHVAVVTLAVAIFITGNVLSGSPLIRRISGAEASDFITTPDTLSAPPAPETKTSDFIRAEALTYEVKPGETLSSIGAAYKLSTDAILYANNLEEGGILSVGQKLTIPPVDGVLHTVKKGDTVESLAKKYDVPPQAIIEFNYLFEPFTLSIGDKVVVPDAKIPQAAPKPKPYYAAVPTGPIVGGTGQFLWPVAPRYITQYFTSYHNGIDIGGYSPIYATDGGKVVASGWNPWGLGNHIRINHGNGYSSTYGHLSRIDVSIGQLVARGEVIGMTGNTGHSFGTHLHFTIQHGARAINPLSVL